MASAELFQQHPDYAITSFPGLADSTCARVLAEIGDDRAWLADARALKPMPDPSDRQEVDLLHHSQPFDETTPSSRRRSRGMVPSLSQAPPDAS